MMRRGIRVLVIAALVLLGGVAGARAQEQQCDFITGGGYIVNNDAKANFGVGGSCKQGGDNHGLWGHLEYVDHRTGLNVHWTTITGYFSCTDREPSDLTSCIPNPSGQPPATRLICGTARTNQTSADVNWAVAVTDNGDKNSNFFSIQVDLPSSGYHRSGFLQGGNIQLHKPNFTGTQTSTCLSLAGGTCNSNLDCTSTQTDCNTVTHTCCPQGTFFNGQICTTD